MSDSPLPPGTPFDPATAWAPWSPDAANPWGLKWAGHLYRRAAFGATWPELQAAIAAGPEVTIDRLLSGAEGNTEFDRLLDEFAPDAGMGIPRRPGIPDGGLRDWWLYRIVHSLHPLRERMTLFWHNHFATSIAKVGQPELMKQQNLLLRRHALGKLRPFLLEISRDPAMLIWLDSNSNVRGKPNENYARELMELFTLGVGRYAEDDVRAAARAFTGWHASGNGFSVNRLQHDEGAKTVLGQTGNWDGGDVVRIVLDQPAAADFLVRKLYRAFISEAEVPPDDLLAPLAAQFRASDYDIAALVRTMLRSRVFFSDRAYRQRIKSPVEYVVGMLHALDGSDLAAGSVTEVAGRLDGLGQTLFAPPNVKGWPGGEAWLNTATLLARHNLAWEVAQGASGPLRVPVSPQALVREHAPHDTDPVDFLLALLLQAEPDEGHRGVRTRLTRFLGDATGGSRDRRLRETTHAILTMPEYQLA
jgi:hypothetical protein